VVSIQRRLEMRKIKVKIKKLVKNIPLPFKSTPGAVGYDLAAAEDAIIKSHSFGVVRTGIAIELPSNIEAQIRPRSGLAMHKGIGVLNSPGTIDPDYRGELKIILFNCSDADFEIKFGDRIAQIVFSRRLQVEFQETKQLTKTLRNEKGFGHTG